MLIDLVNSEEAENMFIHKQVFIESKEFRSRLIAQLKIPTFDNFKKVMFYDVVLKLVFRAFKLNHNKRRMKENIMMLKVINLLKRKKGCRGNEEIEASNMININRDFMIDFDDVKLKDLEEGNKRI